MGVPVSAKMPGCCCPVLCRFLIAVRFLVAEGVAHVLRTEGTPPEAKKARTGAKVGEFRLRKRCYLHLESSYYSCPHAGEQ